MADGMTKTRRCGVTWRSTHSIRGRPNCHLCAYRPPAIPAGAESARPPPLSWASACRASPTARTSHRHEETRRPVHFHFEHGPLAWTLDEVACAPKLQSQRRRLECGLGIDLGSLEGTIGIAECHGAG